MSETSEVRDVSDTAIWVAHYRAEESARPDAMFKDELAALLAGERGAAIAKGFGRTSRYTAWSIITRTVIIDDFIRDAIASGVDAVLNLGAGLDTRPYRLDLPPSLPWIEVDFPHILKWKEDKLQGQTPRCKLQRVAVNLSDATERRAFLASVLPDAKRVLVLTEGVVIYLPEAQVAELARELKSQQRFAAWITEYFSVDMYPILKRIGQSDGLKNSPFQFFPRDWLGFFAANGWEKRQIGFTADIARRFRRSPPMPWLARILAPLLRGKVSARMRESTGYMLLAPRT